MIRLRKSEFEKRGGFGCNNSAYQLLATTCCQQPVAWDEELDDIYFDPQDLTKAIRIWSQDNSPCPLCGASTWNSEELEPTAGVPTEWVWATVK